MKQVFNAGLYDVSPFGFEFSRCDEVLHAKGERFDIIDDVSLANRRTFAYEDVGFPDGIHTDVEGNVWTAAGDGVHVYSGKGQLLGKIFTGELTNNFAFLPGKVLLFSNKDLWIVENVKAVGREICRDFGVCGPY